MVNADRGTALSRSFFSNLPRLYWECRRKPAMAINGRRNKPFGPGGSTRRLRPSPPPLPSPACGRVREGVLAGPKQDRRGRKRRAFARDGSDVTGQIIVANDNYAPVAQAA